jgi:hypothetical protein
VSTQLRNFEFDYVGYWKDLVYNLENSTGTVSKCFSRPYCKRDKKSVLDYEKYLQNTTY